MSSQSNIVELLIGPSLDKESKGIASVFIYKKVVSTLSYPDSSLT